MAKKYAKYDDVPKQYQFDLEDLLGGETIESLIAQGINCKQKWVEAERGMYDSDTNYLAAIKLDEKFQLVHNRISNYLSNKLAVNLINQEINQLVEKYETALRDLTIQAGCTIDHFFQNSSKVQQWIKQPEFDNYRLKTLHLINSKKHKVSGEIEKYLKLTSKGEVNIYKFFSILNYSEIDYGYATDKHKKRHKLNEGNYRNLMRSPDEQLRKSAFQSRSNALFQHRELMAQMLISHFKKVSAQALAQKFSSSVASLIYDDEVELTLLTTLYQNGQKHGPIFAKYRQMYRKAFYKKFKKQYREWDTYVDLYQFKDQYSIDDAQKIIIKALKPLGEEYLSVLKRAFEERWIDYCHVENKRTGAYSIGNTYGINKIYILTNFSDDYDSLSTLAHELGHSLHTYYSNKHQPIGLNDYPIFLAEIASVFNEIMLNDYMLKNANNNRSRLFFLEKLISGFYSTVMVQLEYSNYEYNLYQKIDHNQPVSGFEDLKALYHQTMIQFYSKKEQAKLSKPEKYKKAKMFRSFLIPHYYYDFYVYKYAIGYICAYAFYADYQKRGQVSIDNYIKNFLSQGCSDWPVQLLKKAGVDLYDPNLYDSAFRVINNYINQYIKISKQVFGL